MAECINPDLSGALADACIRSFRHIRLDGAKKKELLAHLGECHSCASMFTAILAALAAHKTDDLQHSSKQSRAEAYRIVLGA